MIRSKSALGAPRVGMTWSRAKRQSSRYSTSTTAFSWIGLPDFFDTVARQFSDRKACRSVICSSNSAEVSPVRATSFHTVRAASAGSDGASQGASA